MYFIVYPSIKYPVSSFNSQKFPQRSEVQVEILFL